MHYYTFCAANSGDGFISFFDTLTDELTNQVFYIKGGPGSGKSTLIKRVAAKAENAELIYCSGDPTSLDAVVLPDKNAVVFDATSPHSFEPRFPAVGGNLIDLGEGWDPTRMNKSKIIQLHKAKSEQYKKCYRLLCSAKELHSGVFEPLKHQFDYTRLTALADRLLKQFSLWECHQATAVYPKRFLSAIGPDGRVTLTDTVRLLCDKIVLVEDRWMIGDLFLSYLERHLKDRSIGCICCYHPLLGTSTLQHLIIPEYGIAFITKDNLFPLDFTDDEITKKVILQNYIEKEYLAEHKNKLGFIKRILKELLNLGTEQLRAARDQHMVLEKEYALGTNFDQTEPLKEKLISNLFGKS